MRPQTTEEDKRPLLENEQIEPEPRSYQVIRPPTPEPSLKVTRSMVKVLAGICYVNLASNACFSVLASFFDKELDVKCIYRGPVVLVLLVL